MRKTQLLTVTLGCLLFLILLPAALFVNFYQNDDWCYYATVLNFLQGKFSLHPYVGPTFYLQGFLGAGFAFLFGINHLPVLTLLMSLGSLCALILILTEILKIDFKWSLVLGSLYFFNLLGVYELWGFMTNHYFMFFFLLGLYFLLKYQQQNQTRNFVLYLIFTSLSLLVRQVALVLPLATALFYFFKQENKKAVINLGFFGIMYAFYSFGIPLTPRIKEVPLQFHHLLNFDYSYAVIYGTLIVLAAYLLPLMINTFKLPSIRTFKNTGITLFVILISYVCLNTLFKPMTISWGEFPYFENVVERTGFYPRNISGTKYYFAGNFELWNKWDLAAKLVLVLFLGLNYRRMIKFNSIFGWYILVYLGLMTITETYYDRYIFILIPVVTLYLLELQPFLHTHTKILLIGQVSGLLFLGYLFSLDFLLVNKYVWNRSQELVSPNVSATQINGTNAWRLTYPNQGQSYEYIFSYDSPQINQELNQNYVVKEYYQVTYPLNIFINPRIYLYQKQ